MMLEKAQGSLLRTYGMFDRELCRSLIVYLVVITA